MKKTVEVTATVGKKLQWHQAFYAGIQIEFAEEANKLISEYKEHEKDTYIKQLEAQLGIISA